MPDWRPNPVISSKVLAVEGLDEKNFFDKLLKYLNITDFQIEDVGGKDKFHDRFPALLKTTGFFAPDESPRVTHLGIIRDKDEDEAFESISNIVATAGLKPPTKHSKFSDDNPKVGIFIMPGSKVKGTMLEDLCLKTVENHPAMKCVNEFASCASALEIKPKNIPKAKVQTFLAAQPEIANSVGVGAQKNYWDFDSPALEELKQFLSHLK
ncbi:MAG: DUF3226 domain-containing protein [Phycisphaerae bacterium]